jgi:hypothetical protein
MPEHLFKVEFEHLESGIEVFTFLVVTVGVVNDVDFRHLGDEHPFSRSLLPNTSSPCVQRRRNRLR